MSLTELQAQQITLIRVLEQTQNNDALWSAQDAKAATSASLDLTGNKTSFAEFVARRADLALQSIKRRTPERAIEIRPPQWHLIAGQIFALTALTAGFLTDLLATSLLHPGQINVVELPLVVLIVWNLAFMAWIFVLWVRNLLLPGNRPTSPLIEKIGALRASESLRFREKQRAPWLDTFKHEWSQVSGPINTARLKVAMNLASLLFTLGALSHLIYRAAFDHYTAGWKTTLTHTIDATTVHTIVSWVLAPGSYLFSMPIPDVQHVELLRMPPSLGEVAENWILLYVGSVLVWVVAPRLCLVCLNLFARWRMRRKFSLPLNTTYFTTLRAAWRKQPIGVSVVPFRYELTPTLRTNIATMLQRIYGMAVNITIDQPVFMGENASDWRNTVKPDGHVAVLVVFNLAATAEGDTHGALLNALKNAIEHGTPIVPIVDTGAYRQDEPERFQQRQTQWRRTLDHNRFKPLFLDLHKATDDDRMSLDHRLNHGE